MTDRPATRYFIRPTADDGTPEGDWQPLSATDGAAEFSLSPTGVRGDDAPAFVPLQQEFSSTITFEMKPEMGGFIRELIHQAAVIEAVVRSQALARAMELGVGVLAITEPYRTSYIVTDLVPPRQLNYCPVEHLAAFIERAHA